MKLAHLIRLNPTPRQEAYFRRACGTARFAWNWGLVAWMAAYAAGRKPNGRALKKQFNAIRKAEFPWTYAVHRDCTSRPFDNLQSAFQHFFRRVRSDKRPGYPKFKKKGKTGDSFYVSCDKIRFDGKHARLPIIGWIKLREALRFEGRVLGATISRKADQWYVAVQMDVGDVHKYRTSDNVIGVDLGIMASATLSTGEVVEGPKALAKNIKRLRRRSRQHSRKEAGSNSRKKAAMKLARLHLRIANIRKDHLNRLSTRLVSENQAVGIEDLHVQSMVRNHKLARAISDEGWGELRRQLGYKAPMWETEIVIHDRRFPSSKMCSSCGNVIDVLSLSCRIYKCVPCGLSIDRDHNAALNLKPLKLPEGIGKRRRWRLWLWLIL